MMKNADLKTIAALAQTSPSTVSKVLNHCHGVDSVMRDRVFRAADSVRARVPEGACDLYVLLPENPAYFWRERTTPALRDIPGLTVKHNVYTVLHDSAQDGYVSRYLAQAERSGARAVIAACTPTAAERAQLAALAQRRLVILLSEDADVPNAFYVGSDARQDGAEIGRRFAQDGGAGLPVILTAPDNKNCVEREQGFRAAAGEAAAGAAALPLPLYGKLFPAKTAALLSALPPAPEYRIYSAAGMLDEVCLAAKKARIFDRCVFYGHDARRPQQERVRAVMAQAVERQSAVAVELAREYLLTGLYPVQKRTIIPSTLI